MHYKKVLEKASLDQSILKTWINFIRIELMLDNPFKTPYLLKEIFKVISCFNQYTLSSP